MKTPTTQSLLATRRSRAPRARLRDRMVGLGVSCAAIALLTGCDTLESAYDWAFDEEPESIYVVPDGPDFADPAAGVTTEQVPIAAGPSSAIPPNTDLAQYQSVTGPAPGSLAGPVRPLPPEGQPLPIATTPAADGSVESLQQGLASGIGDRVFFDRRSAELTPRAHQILVRQAEWMIANAFVTVTLEGHANDHKGDAENLRLGKKRAEAVKDYFVALGVEADRVGAVTYGSYRPAVLGSGDAAKALNRRVEMVVDRPLPVIEE